MTDHRPTSKPGHGRRAWLAGRARAGQRLLLGLGSVLAMILIAVPLASTIALRASQTAANAGNLNRALADANTAQAIEPGAASPYLQRALVFEQADRVGAASRQIAIAITRAPDDYWLWVIASRIATESDHPRQALADYRRAKRLYPTSTLFIG